MAKALKEWIPRVLQATDTFMSETDIPRGTRWRTEISRNLEGAGFGIICLTPENLKKEWVLFEAGALAKHLNDRVCPYLWDLEKSSVPDPLGEFNLAKAEKSDTLELVRSINSVLIFGQLPDPELRVSFERWWDALDSELNRTPAAPTRAQRTKKKSTDEMLELILEEVRTIGRTLPQATEMGALFGSQFQPASLGTTEHYVPKHFLFNELDQDPVKRQELTRQLRNYVDAYLKGLHSKKKPEP